MKKQYIILISVLLVLVVAGGTFFLMKGKTANSSGQREMGQTISFDSLAVGDSVNVFMDESSVAWMITVCGSDGCGFDGGKNPGQQGNPPAGGMQEGNPSPEREAPSSAGTMISGVITAIGEDFLTIDTNDGETKMISVSDSTELIKR